jgi:uncharacterized protein YjeT (DUF2065 family)
MKSWGIPRLTVKVVAQVSNLPYRSASSLRRHGTGRRLRNLARPADWKSAIQQVGNLRYGSSADNLWMH